jgi:hypothetical protein
LKISREKWKKEERKKERKEAGKGPDIDLD